MKFHILMELKDEPLGGGNQFLKALKKEAQKNDSYSENMEDAQLILFNSHHNPIKVLEARKKYSDHIFVHRVDGPMSYRGKNGKRLDQKIFYINNLVADGTIFQSEWSRRQTIQENHKFSLKNQVIRNAPDPKIFFKKDLKEESLVSKKPRLMASSWSSNIMKGFEFFHYLDQTLDFSKYSMSFAGNIEKPFQNIQMLGQLNSHELADELRQHDIFIFASERESCSNSLLEAMHSGLPVLCRNSSSNPEILGSGGLLFDNKSDMLKKLDILVRDYQIHKRNIYVKKISEIFKEYMKFFSSLEPIHRKDKINFGKKLRYKFGLI